MNATVPAEIVEDERFMEWDNGFLWSVYDWVPAPCMKCLGYGTSDECCIPCTNCGGGSDSERKEPEQIATGLYEGDARLLAFGGNLLTVVARLLKTVDGSDNASDTCNRLEEWVLPLARKTYQKMKGT